MRIQNDSSSNTTSTGLRSLLRDQRGLTTVEYIIVLCLIAITGFAVWRNLGDTVKNKISDSNQTLDSLSGTANGR